MSVAELFLSGYQLAIKQQEAVTQSWVTGSHRLGGTLPSSLLNVSIQRAGRLDAVLRCMEDEYTSVAMREEIRPWVAEPLSALSEMWIGQVYEIVRLTLERKLIADSDFFEALAYDFRLLRIPMEKHEIAQDRSLMGQVSMSRTPAVEGDVDYHYDKKDPLRAHIMPTGISQRGSIQWLAIDVSAALSQRWIERRDLSDRVLQLLRA
ncbi:hypothetical protein D7I39_21750 [Allopusillimonas ginsengisoli]|nr:hypothetical protein D7I39_21750 [Allopusillimonas ginsengisoli]